MELTLLIGLSTIFTLIAYIVSYYRHVSRYPKGPMPLPLVGNMFMTPRSLHEHSLIYGPVFTLFVPIPMVVLADYGGLREAFVVKGDDFIDRPDQLENRGVVNSNGDTWRENRRQAISILRDFGMGKNLMEEQVKLSITEYLRCLSKIEDKTKIDMRWPIQLMVSNIINETLFGYRYDYENCDPLINYVETLNKAIVDLSSPVRRFLMANSKWILEIPIIKTVAVARILKNFTKLDEYIHTNVDGALKTFDADQKPECFVHAYAKKLDTDPNLTKKQLYATCSDFFAAGQETTTTTLRWAMLFLAANQDKQDTIREEILRVVGHSRLPSMADRRDMPYTIAACHEVQRRANIVSIVARKTVVDTEVLGFKIPADTVINGGVYNIMAHDPMFADPLEFRPERYLMSDGKTLNKEVVERTVVFGLGRRQCAGEGLARVELFLGLAATLQHYRISPSSDAPIDLTATVNVICLPKDQRLRIDPVSA